MKEYLRKMSIRNLMLAVTGVMAVLWFLGFGYCLLMLKKVTSLAAGNDAILFKSVLHKALIDYLGTPILAFIITYWIGSVLVNETQQLLNVATRISQRDLKVKIEVPQGSSNEIHVIGKAINRIVDNVKEMLDRIKDSITNFHSASEKFSKVVDENLSLTENAFGNIKQLTDYMERLKVQVSNINTSLAQLTEAVNEISKNANETSQEATRANEEAGNTRQILNTLIQEIENIKASADLIQNIAEQTNLLALNATIEAARAGEAGKSFAVVANEVKELSNNSAKSAGEITERVSALINSGEMMKQGMEQIQEVIAQTNDRTINVASAVEEQTSTISELAQNISSIDSEMETLKQILSEIERQTEQTNKLTEEVRQGSKELGEIASLLREELSKYNL